MSKVKKILSTDEIRRGECIEQTQAESVDRAKQDIQREEYLLRPDGDSDVTDVEAQAGRRLTRSEIVTRLQRLNPGLRYHQSKNWPKQGGIYFVGNRHDDVAHTTQYGEFFICGIPHDVVNEFSVTLTEPAIMPDPTVAMHWRTTRKVSQHEPGWRLILLRLLQAGLLSPAGIDREFHITQGRSSQRWKEAVN